MDRISVVEAINGFQQALKKRNIYAERIILFGSCCRGDFSEGSDIDLIVLSEDFDKMSYWERIEVLTDAITDVYEPIEALAVTPQEWEKGDSFLVEFAQDGEVFRFDAAPDTKPQGKKE